MARQFNFTGISPVNANANHLHARARQHALMIYRPNALYSFIPKNACSTMRYSLAVENGFIDGPSQVNWIHQNNDTFIASNREAMEASFAFVILRCPFRRIYSAFMDKFVNMDVQSWELHRITQFAIHPHNFRFVDFVAMLHNPDILYLNAHWMPQSAFLLFKEYDAYYSVEAFDACAQDLQARIGLDVRDARTLTGHATSAFEKVDDGADYARMSALDILGMKKEGKLPSERALFTDEMRAAVTTLYRQDIELYTSHFSAENLLFETG